MTDVCWCRQGCRQPIALVAPQSERSKVTTRDGRRWRLTDINQVVAGQQMSDTLDWQTDGRGVAWVIRVSLEQCTGWRGVSSLGIDLIEEQGSATANVGDG